MRCWTCPEVVSSNPAHVKKFSNFLGAWKYPVGPLVTVGLGLMGGCGDIICKNSLVNDSTPDPYCKIVVLKQTHCNSGQWKHLRSLEIVTKVLSLHALRNISSVLSQNTNTFPSMEDKNKWWVFDENGYRRVLKLFSCTVSVFDHKNPEW